ncbi:auxin-responsive protein SAUR76-like [Apium graveolens]|uniref:auxin-responsive protein SAUR76-like n=1 Tax=Apium graveolens TaxID=4045 RepID=UPI003D790A09
MAKGGKLTKIKSVLKKWHSFGKLSCSDSAVITINQFSNEDSQFEQMSSPVQDAFPVFVGKSRRKYLISSEVIEHPVFRELAESSGGSDTDDETIVVACEVVLFEHLLWMLQNADQQPESLDELVEFYAC